VLSPTLGPLVFVAVLVESDTVEVADFSVDPDDWNLIDDDPGG
jgi:hypothetical protein